MTASIHPSDHLRVDGLSVAFGGRRVFSDLGDYRRPGDTLFRNTAAVLPARLLARRPTGGAVECLLLRPAAGGDENLWWCLLRPGKKLPPGETFGE